MLEPSGVAYINGYGSERALVSKEATGITTKIVQSILGFTTFKDSTFVVNFPHCLHTTNGDNPDRDIVPSYIVCFSILDAYCTRG